MPAPNQGSRVVLQEPQSLAIRSGDSLQLIVAVLDEVGALQDLTGATVTSRVFNYSPQSGDTPFAGPFTGALVAVDTYHSLVTMPVGTLVTLGNYKLQTVVTFPGAPAIQLTDLSDLQVG